MRLPSVPLHRVHLLVGLLPPLLAGCTDEKIVFREPFNPPPDAASGFVGYFTSSDKSTTCGNCHVGHERDWQTTAHADAYATLAANPGAQDFCFTCHTVSEAGNAVSEPAGWNAVQDTAYHDVQCESCHGPGVDHVEVPDEGEKPLASIAASVDATNGCAECHTGTHHPFVEEWSQSLHATPNDIVIERTAEEAPSCIPCHTAQGALAAWGVTTEYLEKGDAVADHEGITCAVCHDPHGSAGTAGQLRFPVDVPSLDQNLCAKCHQRRAEPEISTGSVRGPHSPEGPLLFGEGVGWFPPGFEPPLDQILGTHGSEGNPRVCATCHVVNYPVTDLETGDFQVQVVGHRFEAILCVDANGAPLPAGQQDCELEQRDFTNGCTASGCHATATAARSAYVSSTTLNASQIADVNALLAQVPPDELASSTPFTVAKGARFNLQLAELPGTPIHNPFLIRLLLEASIDALEQAYGLGGAVRQEKVRIDMNRLDRRLRLRLDGTRR